MNPYESAGSVKTVTASIAGTGGAGREGGGAVERVSTRLVVRRLLAYLRPHLPLFLVCLIMACATVLLQLYIPILIGDAIDHIVGPAQVDFAELTATLALLVAVIAAAALTQWAQSYGMNRLSYTVVRDLRSAAYDKVSRLSVATIDVRPHGDLMSRVVNDVDQVGDGLLQGMTQLLSGVVTIVGTIGFMFSVSVPMALVVIIATPLSLATASALARSSSKSFTAQQRLQGELGAHIEEYVGNQRLVNAFSYADRAQEGFDRVNAELQVAGERAQFLSSLSNPGTRFVNNLIYAAVAFVGCLSVITGSPAALTVGGVQVFLSYANQYTKPFNDITSVLTQLQAATASARRLFVLLDAEEEGAHDDPAAPAIEAARGAVSFDHVTFGYDPAHPVLHDITLAARPGERVALVGPTGCGKTTLINLLLRFYDAQAGTITLDGRDIQTIDRASLRRSFGMVLQDTWLFEGTVHDNIAYGCPDATREMVERAARRAHANRFIEGLPQGYDTVLTAEGGTLSQGQCQLLTIARAMLADPAVLLLDEATSRIDTRTELQVQSAFDELMLGRTSFVVAHRLSTIQGADRILVMRDGRIIESGTHEELLARDGFYAELYRSQWSRSEDTDE